MKIVKIKKKAIEIEIKYEDVFICMKSYEEYLKILDWHQELNHTWRSGASVFNNPYEEFYRKNKYILIKDKFYLGSSCDKRTISFDEFLKIGYKLEYEL